MAPNTESMDSQEDESLFSKNSSYYQLSETNIKKYAIAKTLDTSNGKVNSLAFSNTGDHLIIGCHDDTITLFDVNRGAKSLILNSKKYGVEKIKFTNEPSKVIYASNKVDHAIRYQSLEDNKYIRYFSGHNQQVTSLEMVTDSSDNLLPGFISASKDMTVRLWDLKKPECIAAIDCSDQNLVNQKSTSNKKYYQPLTAIDPENLVFAVVTTILDQSLAELRFYDIRNYSQGPFLIYNIVIHNQAEIHKIRFSPDGKYLLLITNLQKAYICDTVVSGVVKDFTFSSSRYKRSLSGNNSNSKYTFNPLIGNFTPDGQYLFFCREDGSIKWFKIDDWTDIGHKWEMYGQPEMIKYPEHVNRNERSLFLKEQPFIFTDAAFNDKYAMCVMASNRGLHCWLPAIAD